MEEKKAPPEPAQWKENRTYKAQVQESVDSVEKRFRVDTKKPLRLPTREELCYLALDVYKLALARRVDYVNKKGVAGSKAEPHLEAAVSALKTAGELAGYGKNAGAARRDAEEKDQLSAEQALQRLRSKLAKELDDEPTEPERAEAKVS